MLDRDVEITRADAPLRGTLAMPSRGEAQAVILMIHGSGPLDRNENMSGQALDIFNALAAELARGGYASLRYDKRGCGLSGGDYYTSGHGDFLADAAAWVEYLEANQTLISRHIYILGHSVGTLIAAQLAAEKRIAGLILLCPFIRGIEAILRKQAAIVEHEMRQISGLRGVYYRLTMGIFGGPVGSQEKLITRLKTTREPSLRHGLSGRIDARCLREEMAIAPAEVYAAVKVPALVFAGANDVQCDPADAAAIGAILGEAAEVHVEPGLSHILRKEERPGGFLGYAQQLRRPMDDAVAARILLWLRTRMSLQGPARGPGL